MKPGKKGLLYKKTSDSLIAIKYAETKDFAYFKMKSLDILSFYHNESGGFESEEVYELVRVKQNPPLRCGNTMEHNFPPKKK